MFKQNRWVYFSPVEGGDAFERGRSIEKPKSLSLGEFADDFAGSMVEDSKLPVDKIKADPQYQHALRRVKSDFSSFWLRYKGSKDFEALKAAHPGVLHNSMDDESMVEDLAEKIMLNESLRVWRHNQRPGVAKWRYGFSMSATTMLGFIVKDIVRLEGEAKDLASSSRLSYEMRGLVEAARPIKEWSSKDFPFRDYPNISEVDWKSGGIYKEVKEYLHLFDPGADINVDGTGGMSKCVLFKGFPGEDTLMVFKYRPGKAKNERYLTLSFTSEKGDSTLVYNYELVLPGGFPTDVTDARINEIQQKEIQRRLKV